jgi:hypothetical protein
MKEKFFNILMVILALLWGSAVFLILAPNFGIITTIYPRPSPDYQLIALLLSGLILAVFSLRKGVIILQSS